MPHFLDLNEIPAPILRGLVDEALARKATRADKPKGAADADSPLKDYVLGVIFEKSSTRTRLSFDVAMGQLGGRAIILDSANAHLERGESMEDTAGVLSGYVDGVVLRTGEHQRLLALANSATVPVINGLSDHSHPCQIIAALMTIKEQLGTIQGVKVAWYGDSNNVLRSWIHACPAFGFKLAIASPEHGDLSQAALDWAKAQGGDITLCTPQEAARDASILTTDCWLSLSDDPKLANKKSKALAPYKITSALMALAKPEAYFMHCLPLYRGKEVEAEIADGARSLIFQEAENRIHAQKAILFWALKQ